MSGELTVGRVTFSPDIRRNIMSHMPKIKEAVMSEIKPKKLTIVEIQPDASNTGFKVILSDGSELGGVERVAIDTSSQNFAGVKMLVRL